MNLWYLLKIDSSFTGRDRLFHLLRWCRVSYLIARYSLFNCHHPRCHHIKSPKCCLNSRLSECYRLFHRLRRWCRASYQIAQSAQVASRGAAQVVLQSVKHSHACTTTNTKLFGFIQGFILNLLLPPQNQLWWAAFDLFLVLLCFCKKNFYFPGQRLQLPISVRHMVNVQAVLTMKSPPPVEIRNKKWEIRNKK